MAREWTNYQVMKYLLHTKWRQINKCRTFGEILKLIEEAIFEAYMDISKKGRS